MAITFSAVIFCALILMCSVPTLFVVNLLSLIDRRRQDSSVNYNCCAYEVHIRMF